jgi:hypothetical protein
MNVTKTQQVGLNALSSTIICSVSIDIAAIYREMIEFGYCKSTLSMTVKFRGALVYIRLNSSVKCL